MTPVGAIADEYVEAVGGPNFILTQGDRARIWMEHCARQQRADENSWLKVLAILAIVAAFFAGFATCAVELVR